MCASPKDEITLAALPPSGAGNTSPSDQLRESTRWRVLHHWGRSDVAQFLFGQHFKHAHHLAHTTHATRDLGRTLRFALGHTPIEDDVALESPP